MSWKDAAKGLDISGYSSSWKDSPDIDGTSSVSWRDACNLSSSWNSGATPLDNDLMMMSVEEREAQRESERLAKEDEEHFKLQKELEDSRRVEDHRAKQREAADAKEQEKMSRENASYEARVQAYGTAAENTIDMHSIISDPVIWQSMAENEKKLEVAAELERMLEAADQKHASDEEKARMEFILRSQREHDLGLSNAHNPVPITGKELSQRVTMSAEEALKGTSSSAIKDVQENPPVYTEKDIFSRKEKVADPSFWPTVADAEPGFKNARCFQCFDAIVPNIELGFCGRACKKGDRYYHSECYFKTGAPECHYCGIPLVRNSEKKLSGEWGVHNGESYHVECYQLYAGPRCCLCWDVIFADPSKPYRSGRWIPRGNDELMHEECYNYHKKRLDEEIYGISNKGPMSSPPTESAGKAQDEQPPPYST